MQVEARLDRAAAACTEPHPRFVAGDGVDVRFARAEVRIEPLDAVIKFQKRVLQHLFSILTASQQLPGERVNVMCQQLVKGFKGGVITRLQPEDKVCLGTHSLYLTVCENGTSCNAEPIHNRVLRAQRAGENTASFCFQVGSSATVEPEA